MTMGILVRIISEVHHLTYPLTSIRLRGFSLLHIVRETINQERGLGKNEEIFRNKICMDTSDF